MPVIDLSAGPDGGPVQQLEGRGCEAGVSLVFTSSAEPGAGPYLHKHPYAETFVIHSGRARFTVGEEELEASAGQVVVVPGFTPHRFAVIGPETFRATSVHANDTFVTEWLEGPQAEVL